MIPNKPNRGAKERPWTTHHDAILVQMKAAGMTLDAIGERLNRTPASVSSRAYQISVADAALPKPPKDHLGEKIEAYLARIAKLNRAVFADVGALKREAYGWR